MVLVLLILYLPSALWAQNSPLVVSIKKYWQQSAELQQLKQQREWSRRLVLSRMLPESPEISYQKDRTDQSDTYLLNWTFAFPGKSLHLRERDLAAVKQKEAELLAKQKELTSFVVQSYVDCALATLELQIRQRNLSDWESFFNSLKVRRGVSTFEKLSLELETRQARRDWEQTKDRQTNLCAFLEQNRIMIGPIQQLESDLPHSFLQELGPDTPTEIRLQAQNNYGQAILQTASWSELPDWTLSVGRRFVPAGPLSADFSVTDNIYGISIKLPLFYSIHERTRVEREKTETSLQIAEQERQLSLERRDKKQAAWDFLRAKKQLSELQKHDLPAAQNLADNAYSDYRAGRIGYAEMVLSRRAFVDLSLQELQLSARLLQLRTQCWSLCETPESIIP